MNHDHIPLTHTTREVSEDTASTAVSEVPARETASKERQTRIAQLLRPAQTCRCGQKHPVLLKALVMEPGALAKLPAVLEDIPMSCCEARICMICDQNTYAVAGAEVENICRLSQTICLPAEHLHATDEVVTDLEARMPPCDLLLAVGSGTVHDITRYMATARGIDFVSVPTAASVDGYLSSIAAMTWHGVKRSFPAKPPVAMVADSTIIAAAPPRLTAAGVGDLLGKYTALFDWRAAHLCTGEYICEDFVVALEEEAIAQAVACLDRVRVGDAEAVETVMYGLVLSGLAMQMVGNSRPASGSEHHISHLIEMNVLPLPDQALHGEKVGVATGLVCDVYHKMLDAEPRGAAHAVYAGFPEAEVREAFGARADEVIAQENTPDPLADPALAPACVASHWEELRALAKRTLPSGERIRTMLRAVGAPATLEDIQIPDAYAPALCRLSPYVRRRVTFMRISKALAL